MVLTQQHVPFVLTPLHAGDDWCQLLVDGPMSKRECHLELLLTQAQCGQLLNAVNDAKGLEELSLMVCFFQYPFHLLCFCDILLVTMLLLP